jgi:putative MATE family efflux protein
VTDTDGLEQPPKPRQTHGRRDLTQGPITRTLLAFSLPVLGSNVLQSLNGSVNQFWVSHTLGLNAVTAIGNANIIMMLLLGSIFGVSMAANILIAQAVGAREMPIVKKVMGTAVAFFVLLATLIAVVGFLTSPHILSWMGTPPEAKAEAIIYLRIVFLSMPFMCGFVFLQMAQRGVGDSRTPFYFMLLAVVLDVILNPLLIRGIGPFPRMDIAGSATSTFIGQGLSLACLIAWLYRKRSPLALRRSDVALLRPDGAIIRILVGRGLPMGAQMLIISGSAVIMIGMVNAYGAVTAAAYTAASQVWTYLQMPAIAIGAAVSSMAAQNIGAQRWDRVHRIAMSGLVSSLVITSVTAGIIYLLGDLTIHIFLPAGSPAMPVADHINRIALCSWILIGSSFVLTGVVRAAGAVVMPLVVLVIALWVVRLPFAMLLQPHIGPDAIWWSFPVGGATAAALTGVYYLRGGWRRRTLLPLPSRPGGHGHSGDGPARRGA